jgi:hypothetical protein
MKTGPVKELLVVGGGTAGWLTAFWLNRCLHKVGCLTTKLKTVAAHPGPRSSFALSV